MSGKLIRFDWALKKLLRSKVNFGILEGFLSELLGDDIKARGLKEAKEKLDAIKLLDEDRKEYERYLEDLHYQASMLESSYGIGKMEGMKEGKMEGKMEVAKNLLGVLDDKTISEKTGLPIDMVKMLRSE